jgi:DNA-binding NtrC family response regulator
MSAPPYPAAPLLIVDDEQAFLHSAEFLLAAEGLRNVVLCPDSRQVMALLGEREFSAVLLDLSMPHVSGRELLPRIVEEHPELPVVVLTGVNEVETAVGCMRAGAFDYLVKPVEDSHLVAAIRHALELTQIRGENARLKQRLLSGALEHPEAFAEIVTRSERLRAVFQYAEAIAATPLPVLVTGETGVGKELVSVALHRLSGRAGQFVAVNVAGLDDTLFSDTLFGHKRGAFTGADKDRPGLLEQAAGGTIFLDEIGDLSAQSQIKLLRLLQERRYYPLGSDLPKPSDARVIVATNRDLTVLQREGGFRKDLYFRLRAHHIQLPPLRERKEDIPLLIDHLLDRAAQSLGRKRPTPPRELYTLLASYSFPGNVRELEGLVFDAVSRHRSGVLSLESFLQAIGAPAAAAAGPEGEQAPGQRALHFGTDLPTLREAVDQVVQEALRRCGGNQSQAARLLGLSRRALNNRLRRGEP